MDRATVTFTPEKLVEFKRLYELHKKDGKDTFFYEEKEYVTAYAKYVIQYLDGKFKSNT